MIENIENEFEKLKKERNKIEKDLVVDKKKFIQQIKNIDKKTIKNTESNSNTKNYSIWKRIRKVLGMS